MEVKRTLTGGATPVSWKHNLFHRGAAPTVGGFGNWGEVVTR